MDILKKNILIVDDEEIIRDLLMRTLTREGFLVSTATTGLEGLAAIRDKHFDLVVSDVLMPEMDGITMLETLRSGKNKIPAIIITGFAKDHNAQSAKALGACDFIAKPFRNAEILRAVRAALSSSDSATPLEISPVEPNKIVELTD